jgi:hypothetical protein
MVQTANFRRIRFLATPLLLITAVGLSLIISEGILRLLFEKKDYLTPDLISDKILGHKVAPGSGGHDAWGFRNKFVPKQADIVAIGDSLTYGVSASAANSWPAILQRLTQKSTYNMALGGYGPVQYSYLLENKAVLLKPSSVIVGFYYGNDLRDAFNTAYNNDYWKKLRSTSDIRPDINYGPVSIHPIFLGSLREYLAHHSILYASAMLSFGEVFRFLEMKYDTVEGVSVLEDPVKGVRTGFTGLTAEGQIKGLRLRDPAVKEGLRISLDLFLQMKRFCDTKGISFHVVLLPTKESVFSEYIDRDDTYLRDKRALRELLENEREVDELVKRYFEQNYIVYVDVLKPLRNAIGKQIIYPTNQDGHPNKNGYEIIAKTILAQLNNE